MAINIELAESAGLGKVAGGVAQVMIRPLVDFTNITAAGVTALNTSTRVVSLKLRADSDSVYVLVQPASASVQAAAGTGDLLAAGEQLDFVLPSSYDGSDYEIDVRAA